LWRRPRLKLSCGAKERRKKKKKKKTRKRTRETFKLHGAEHFLKS
jgi:hypothetical protein